MKETKLISAFPCCGKSYLFNKQDELGISILDSDSSNFSWIIEDGKKVRNPDFPNNYINHIKENIGKVDYIFISSHEDVRTALYMNMIDFILIYPNVDLKHEWIYRMKKRGNDEKFIEVISENWYDWILECKLDHRPIQKIELNRGQYIQNIISDLR